jgi:hypothetical protein
MVVMGEDEGRGSVSHCYRKTALYRTIEVMMGVQLSICILIRNVIFSIVFFTNKQQDVLFVFLIVFVFLEYISVHHNLPCCS